MNGVPYITAFATLSDNFRSIRVMLINKHADLAANVSLDFNSIVMRSTGVSLSLTNSYYVANELYANCTINSCQWYLIFSLFSLFRSVFVRLQYLSKNE